MQRRVERRNFTLHSRDISKSDNNDIATINIHKYLYLVFKDGIRISLKEHLINGHVKRGNHFLWIGDKLTIKIGIELTHVFTVDVEKRLTNDTYLCTTLHNYD